VFTIHGFFKWKRVNDGRKCAFLNHIGSEPCSEHNNNTTMQPMCVKIC
jgi:hypothetical protein